MIWNVSGETERKWMSMICKTFLEEYLWKSMIWNVSGETERKWMSMICKTFLEEYLWKRFMLQ